MAKTRNQPVKVETGSNADQVWCEMTAQISPIQYQTTVFKCGASLSLLPGETPEQGTERVHRVVSNVFFGKADGTFDALSNVLKNRPATIAASSASRAR